MLVLQDYKEFMKEGEKRKREREGKTKKGFFGGKTQYFSVFSVFSVFQFCLPLSNLWKRSQSSLFSLFAGLTIAWKFS